MRESYCCCGNLGVGWHPLATAPKCQQMPNIILDPPFISTKSSRTSVFFYLQVWVSRVSLTKLEAEKVELATKASDQTILVIKDDVGDHVDAVDAVDAVDGDDYVDDDIGDNGDDGDGRGDDYHDDSDGWGKVFWLQVTRLIISTLITPQPQSH